MKIVGVDEISINGAISPYFQRFLLLVLGSVDGRNKQQSEGMKKGTFRKVFVLVRRLLKKGPATETGALPQQVSRMTIQTPQGHMAILP